MASGTIPYLWLSVTVTDRTRKYSAWAICCTCLRQLAAVSR